MVADGEEAISALPQRAQRIADLLSSNYPASTLAAVASEFAKLPMVDGKSALNAKVTELGQLVREEAAVACADLRRAEMWIRLKTPSVSDGNNFGVRCRRAALCPRETSPPPPRRFATAPPPRAPPRRWTCRTT